MFNATFHEASSLLAVSTMLGPSALLREFLHALSKFCSLQGMHSGWKSIYPNENALKSMLRYYKKKIMTLLDFYHSTMLSVKRQIVKYDIASEKQYHLLQYIRLNRFCQSIVPKRWR